MIARKLMVLLMLLAFGVSVEVAHEAGASFGVSPAGCRVLTGRFQGPSFPIEQPPRTFDVGAATQIEVSNAFGRVEVVAGEGTASLSLRCVVFQPTRAQAEAFASKIRVAIEAEGDVLRVGTNRPELERLGDVGFETHLRLELPAESRLRVTNEHGAVLIDGLAAAEVTSSFDAVEVRNITGGVHLESRHAHVLVSAVGGELDINTRHGELRVSGVTGRTRISQEHGNVLLSGVGPVELEVQHGDATLADVRGNARVRAQHGGVKVERLEGNLDAETEYRSLRASDVSGGVRALSRHGGIALERVGGDVFADAIYDDIVLEDVGGSSEVHVQHGGVRATRLQRGAQVEASGDDVVLLDAAAPIRVEARRGNVRVRLSRAPTEDVEVAAAAGDIHVELPTPTALRVEAVAAGGSVHVELDGLTVSESDARRVVGHVGEDGPRLALRADQGDVRVSSADASDAALRGPQPIR